MKLGGQWESAGEEESLLHSGGMQRDSSNIVLYHLTDQCGKGTENLLQDCVPTSHGAPLEECIHRHLAAERGVPGVPGCQQDTGVVTQLIL